MADILQMLSNSNSPQDDAAAMEIIKALLLQGGAAAPQPAPQGMAGWSPLQTAQAQSFDMAGGIGQISSPDIARQLLGGAATPAPAAPMQSAAETARLGRPAPISPVEQALIDAAAAQSDSRTAAILDAASMPSAQGQAEKGPTSKEGTVESVTEDGIAKVKKPDGSYLFTNVKDAQGGYTSAYVPEKKRDHNPLGKPVSSSIQEQLKKVREAPDSATAEVLASGLNASLTAEFTTMENDAYDMAATELGVEKIKKALLAQQSLDAAQRAYNPAMGDSAQTSQLRSQLNAVETQAQKRAADWLGRNIGYNQLKATQNDAKLAVDLAVRKAAAGEDRAALVQLKNQEKAESREEMAAGAVAAMTPAQRSLLVKVNPELSKQGAKDSLFVQTMTTQLKSNPEFQELWKTDASEYSALAMAGNKTAQQLIISEESAAVGLPEDQVRQEIETYAKMPLTDANVKKWAERNINAPTSEEKNVEVAKFVMNWKNAGAKLGPQQKKERTALESQLKASAVREARQQRVTGDVLSWAPSGTPLAEAARKAKEISGKAELSSTLAVLVKDKSTQEKIQIYNDVRAQMIAEAKRFDNSSFGALDAGTLVNQFNQTAINMGDLADSIRAYFYGGMEVQGSTIVPTEGFAAQRMNDLMFK